MTATRAAVLAAIAVAGCYDDTPGMRIVIRDPGFDADHVELFISTRSADTDRIGPDRARANETRDKLQGAGYFLDGPGDGITPLTRLDFKGKRVVWDLHAEGDSPSHVKLLVAVAFDANNTAIALAMMHDFDVPANDTIAAVLDLEPAMQMPPSDEAQPQGIRVWPWRKANADAAACLGIEYSDGERVKERKWLVPEDDPDCDEVEIECDKHLYHADFSNAAMPCIVSAIAGPNHVPCRLGSKFCEDGVNAGACTPVAEPPYCLANALCDPEQCFNDSGQCQMIDSSGVDCELAIQADGLLCGEPTLGYGPLTLLLSSSTGSSALFPGGCQAVGFASMETIGGVAPFTIVAGGATFSIEGLSNAMCSFRIEVAGQFDITALSNGQPVLLVLDVTRAGAHLIIPVFVKLVPGTCLDRAPACLNSRATIAELATCQ